MRRYFMLLLLCCIPLSPCHGQVVDLVCSGTMQSRPANVTGTVAPGATHIDLGVNTILTPVGTFEIIRLDDSQLSFGGLMQGLHASGTLDRVSGEMTVFFRNDEEKRRMQAGLEHTYTMYARLRCSTAKKLF